MSLWNTSSLPLRGVLSAVVLAGAVMIGGVKPAHAIDFESFGVEAINADGTPARQAGSHPDMRVRFEIPTEDPSNPLSSPIEQSHRFQLDLPPGTVGNPQIGPTCPESGMQAGVDGNLAACPVGSQVGYAEVSLGDQGDSLLPVFNLQRPADAPAVFAFNVLGVIVKLKPTVRSGDYGISIDSGVIASAAQITSADVRLWGVPADPANDRLRVSFGGSIYCYEGTCHNPPVPSQAERKPFLTLPTSCPGTADTVTARLDGWTTVGSFASRSVSSDLNDVPLVMSGCERLAFEPSISTSPTSSRTDAPSGLEVNLRVPQSDAPDGLATAHVKNVTTTFPEGMSVSPSSARGLGACSPTQIALDTTEAPSCPRSSKIGTVTVETPLLDEPMTGDVILATPDQNPFGSLVALYIVAEGSGVRIKLPGRVDTNPVTGQLTATFSNNPQLPFSALKVRLDGGENASLATPTQCGRYETKTTVTSWSGKSVDLTSPMVIDQNCASSPRGFDPGVNAGSVTPLAAKNSAFVLDLDRPDGQQNYASVGVKMPPGLLARIGDIDLCGEQDAAVGSCSDNSLIGTVRTTAGPGSAPLPVRGKAYLTGPYKGGPYGLAIVVPTAGQAGPFDLGNVVVRARINVDRKDAHVTVTSDPMPTILRGFPLRIRQVQVAVDHGRFMFNPSSCAPLHVGVAVHGTKGGVKDTKVPYRVAGCGDLKQDQKIALAFTNKSQQRPGKHPGVEARMTSKGPGGANLKKVAVKLPLSVALDPKNAKALCKPEQRAALNCPKDSIVGRATAKSVLKEQLTGPIYFVEGTRTTKQGRVIPTLPKLWIPLMGGGVTIDVNADSHVSRRQLVSTFSNLPDAPITEFRLRINSGRNGILTVPPSKDGGTCQRDRTVHMQLTGHNGAVKEVRSKVNVAGCKAKPAKKGSAKPAQKQSASKGSATRR